MTMRRTGMGLALLSAGSLAILWFANALPLGVPGEWTWTRIPVESVTVLVLGGIWAAVIGGIYIALTAFGAGRIETAGTRQVGAGLAGLCIAAFAWLWAVQESPTQIEYELSKADWVLYYPGAEGYFAEARYVMKDVPSYLGGYEQRMAQGDFLHFGTHPPGLILFHRVCIGLCSAFPSLRDWVLHTQPASLRKSMDVTEDLERKGPRPITSADRAAIWLAALVTQAFAACAIVPIYLLVRRDHSRTISWWTASLWPLVPALAVFLPKSDAFFPFLAALFLWTWLEGFRRASIAMCFLAGFALWFTMFLSLAILPVVAAAALLTLWEAALCVPHERGILRIRDWPMRIGAAASGWALPILVVWIVSGMNLLVVWQWNYRNHSAFYDHYPRTYWKWLIVNPIELSFAVGVPIMVAAILGFRNRLRKGWRQRAMGPYWCLTATWLLLLCSGKNMGEAARLWLVIMPWPVWFAAGFFSEISDQAVKPVALGGQQQTRPNRLAIFLIALQMAVSLGTVMRVTGFEFPNLPDALTLPTREKLPDQPLVDVTVSSTKAIPY